MHGDKNTDSPLAFAKFKMFAHHPTCYRHNHHLFRAFGLELCLGCTGLFLGIIIGVGIYLTTDLLASFNLISIWAIGIILYLPTLIQPNMQFWPYKLISRTLLGVAIFIMLSSLVLKIDWFSIREVGIAILYLIIFDITRRSTLRYRHVNIDDPCIDCPHGMHPFCLHHLEDLKTLDCKEAGLEDEFVETLVQQLETPDKDGEKLVIFERV